MINHRLPNQAVPNTTKLVSYSGESLESTKYQYLWAAGGSA